VAAVEQRLARAGDVCGKRRFFFECEREESLREKEKERKKKKKNSLLLARPPSTSTFFFFSFNLKKTRQVQFNVVLFAFNLLLPAYPLDGGRALADLLLMCGVGVQNAGKAVSVRFWFFFFRGGLLERRKGDKKTHSFSLFKFFSLLAGPRPDCEFLFLSFNFYREEVEEENTHPSLFFNPPLSKPFHQIGLLILVYGFYRKMLLTIAVGVWMLFSTFELLAFVVKGKAGEHPLFCFEENGGEGGGEGGGAAAAAAAPPPPAAAQPAPASQWSFAPQRPAAAPAAPVPANPFAASTEMTRPNV
jgi:hypothetical protein